MCEQKRKIIESLWNSLFQPSFDLQNLTEGIIKDCGHDAGQLTEKDLSALFHGKYENDWHEVAFAFNEVLAQYSTEKLNGDQVVRAVFVSLFFEEAVSHGEGDLWYSFEKIFEIVCNNRDKIGSEFVMMFLAELLKGVSDRK